MLRLWRGEYDLGYIAYAREMRKKGYLFCSGSGLILLAYDTFSWKDAVAFAIALFIMAVISTIADRVSAFKNNDINTVKGKDTKCQTQQPKPKNPRSVPQLDPHKRWKT